MLNEKELSLLSHFAQLTQKEIHLEDLAKQHKLSTRSIRLYVNKINQTLGKDCISLKKGVYQVTEQNLLQEFLEHHQVTHYSAPVLVSFLLHKLVLEDGINLSHFVTEFEISRTTAKNYLNQTKETLELYHLSLDHSGKIMLLGKEFDKRRLLLNLLLEFHRKDEREAQLIRPLLKDFEQLEIAGILAHYLEAMLLRLNYTLSEHSNQILLNDMLITIYRNKRGHCLQEIENKIFLKNSQEYQNTKDLFAQLEEALDMRFPQEEALEVVNKIMGLHYSTDKESEHHNWFEYDLFISKLIRRFSKGYGVNLVGDFRLYEQLLNHIKPAMYRIAHHIKLHQFDSQAIVDLSQKEYDLTRDVLQQLHFFPYDCDVKAYQDEISLICVYFKQAIHEFHSNTEKNVLFVSNYGYGSGTMLMEKLRSHFQVAQIEWIQSYDLARLEESNYHLIITTERNLNHPSSLSLLPVVEISPFFQDADRGKLAEFLSHKESVKLSISQLMEVILQHQGDSALLEENLLSNFSQFLEDDRKKTGSISQFLEESCILLDVEGETMEEVLQIAGGLLVKQGYILPSYVETLVESFENYGVYMMIEEDVAIPHTKNTGNVLKTGFSFVRLRQPIEFADHSLSMFFTFCTVNNKEHLEALIRIADTVKQEGLKQSMKKLSTPQELLTLLENWQEEA